MLLAGLGVGALASQLGSVTVSAVPDEQSAEVGGIQNTVTNLGASIGAALAGAILIAVLTSSFLAGVKNNPDVPKNVASPAQVDLAGGIPFLSDKDLHAALDEAKVCPKTAGAIVAENADARIAGCAHHCRCSLLSRWSRCSLPAGSRHASRRRHPLSPPLTNRPHPPAGRRWQHVPATEPHFSGHKPWTGSAARVAVFDNRYLIRR